MIRQTNILKQYKLEPNNRIFKKNIYEILSLLKKDLKKTTLELKSDKKAHPDLKTMSLYQVDL